MRGCDDVKSIELANFRKFSGIARLEIFGSEMQTGIFTFESLGAAAPPEFFTGRSRAPEDPAGELPQVLVGPIELDEAEGRPFPPPPLSPREALLREPILPRAL